MPNDKRQNKFDSKKEDSKSTETDDESDADSVVEVDPILSQTVGMNSD